MIKLLLLLFVSTSAYAQALDPKTKEVFVSVAKEVGISSHILIAICRSESDFRQFAFVQHDGGVLNPAVGMCQLLYHTAKELGWKEDPKCLWARKGCTLFNLRTNIYYAAKMYKKQLDRYDGSVVKAIAAYNAGSARMCEKTSKRCTKGKLINETYVIKTLKNLEDGQ